MFAIALGTTWMRFLVLGDVLTALENFSAFAAAIFVGRHRRFLQVEPPSGSGAT